MASRWMGYLFCTLAMIGVGSTVVVSKLIAHGLPQSTPAAVVENATLAGQRVVEGTLRSLPEEVKAARVGPPALLIVGEVVRLRKRLAWFDGAMERDRVAAAIS